MTTKTLPEIREEIEEGCGKRIRVQDINTKCGGEVGDIGLILKVYCPTCQAKLQTLNECEDAFKEIIIENYYGWLPDFKDISKIKNEKLKNVLQHIKSEYEELLSQLNSKEKKQDGR